MSLDIPKDLRANSTTAGTTQTTGTTAVSSAVPNESIFTKSTQTTSSTNQTQAVDTAVSATQTTKTEQIPSQTSEPTVSAIEVTETTAQTETPKEKSLIEQYAIEHGFDIDEAIADIKRKQMTGEISEQEKLIADEIDNKQKQETEAEKENKAVLDEAEIKFKKYTQISLSSNKTNYQKASATMDLYLSEHDEEYKNLKTDKEKQAYRDKLIHNLLLKVVPGAKEKKNGQLNITQSQRLKGFEKISAIYTLSDMTGKSVEEYTSMKPEELNKEVNKLNQVKTSGIKLIINEVLNNNSKTDPDELLRDLADKKLTETDDKYNNLKGEEKERYLKEEIASIVSEVFDMQISVQDLDDPNYKGIKAGACALLKEWQNQGETDKFKKLTTKESARIQLQAFDNNPDFFKNFSQEEKEQFEQYKTRLKIISDSKKDRPTEMDIYNELKIRQKTGTLTKAEKTLLDYYDILSKNPGSKVSLNKEAKSKSIASICALTGKTREEVIDMYTNKIDFKRVLSEDGDPYLQELCEILKVDGTFENDEQLINYLKEEKSYNDKQIREIRHRYGLNEGHIHAREVAHRRPEAAGKYLNNVHKYGTEEDIENLKPQVKHSVKYFDKDQLVEYQDGLSVTWADSMAQGMAQYKTKEENVYVVTELAKSQNTSDAYKSTLTSTLVEVSKPEAQVYYGQELSKITNAAVTEGLAAAEQHVDSSVRTQYSQYVDNAIKNNTSYTPEQRENIEQARQSGQTSYQREISSNNQRSNTSASQNSSTSSQSSSATRGQTSASYSTNSNPAPVKSSSNYSSSVYDEPSSSVSTTKTTSSTAKTDYSKEVTQALSDKKEVVEKRLTQIIDNYQKSVKTEQTTIQTTAQTQTTKVSDTGSQYIAESEKSGKIPPQTLKELKSAYNSGGITGLYEKLGSLSSSAQEKFLSYFALNAGEDALHNFASSYSGNKGVIISLYNYSKDASLLSYLDGASTMDLLAKGKIKMEDFLKYASPSTVALYINELNKMGNKEQLRQIFGLLDNSKLDYASQHLKTEKKVDKGGDAWLEQLSNNMSSASRIPTMSDALAMGSDKVPMRGDYDKMKLRGPFYFNA